ncbi:MAG: exodeoxyribonuclease VII large subunit, partial [Saprospiraceae bacterium]
RSLKTPTAVADFVIEHNAAFENRLDEVWKWIREESKDRLRAEQLKLSDLMSHVHHAVRSRIILENNMLDNLIMMIRQGGKNMINGHSKRLDFIYTLLSAIDPDKVLARGYTITTHEGRSVSRASELSKGMNIQTTFRDGAIKSIIE